MIISHYGVGFAAKRLAPKASLFALIGASLLPDILWLIFLLFGLERASGAEGATPSPAAIVGGTFSHSLLASVACAALAGLVYHFIRSDWRGALAIALCVLSHWCLDALANIHTLPLYPGGDASFGLGLERYAYVVPCLEGGLFVSGVWLYAAGTRKTSDAGVYGLWVFVAVTLLAYVSTLFMPQFSDRQVAWRIVILLFTLPIYLLQGQRTEKERRPKPKRQRTRAESRRQSQAYVPPTPSAGTDPQPPRKAAAQTQIKESGERARSEQQAPAPRAHAHGWRIRWWLLAGAAAALVIPLAAAPLVKYLYAGSAESPSSQTAAAEASPESGEAAEERRQVAEAIERKVEQCRRVSTERSEACRKALEHYKGDPVVGRLLREGSEEGNVGGLTTLVVTNWKRHNFADVFSSPAELGLEPVEDPRSLQSLVRAGAIKIERVLLKWYPKRQMFLVYLRVTNLRGDDIEASSRRVRSSRPSGRGC